jgi:hypothetical protein
MTNTEKTADEKHVATEEEFDSILNTSIDEIDDLPDYANFPDGTHNALLTLEKKQMQDEPRMVLNLKYVSSITLVSLEEEAPKAGTIASTIYDVTHPLGGPAFKKAIGNVLTAMEIKNFGEALKQIQDIPVVVTTKISTTKKAGETYKRMRIISMILESDYEDSED